MKMTKTNDPFLFSKPIRQLNICFIVCVLFSIISIGLFSLLNIYLDHIVEEIRIGKTKALLFISHWRPKQSRSSFSPQFQLNSTHLWSIELADDQYKRLSRSIPCRTVTYLGVNQYERFNSCDSTVLDEFSRQTTIESQKWIFSHQHPQNCSNQRFAVINRYALSGFGSTIHQIVWAFGKALSEDRIAVYASPGDWLFGDCLMGNPDCYFLPISNCSVPKDIDGDQVTTIDANIGYWIKPILPDVFRNRTFNWFRSQLLFYLMRYNTETFESIRKRIETNFSPPSINLHRPFVSIYVRRSDKIRFKEMSRSFSLKEYFSLFHDDIRHLELTNIYLNSEDSAVFDEFQQLNKTFKGRFRLLKIDVQRNVVYRKLLAMSSVERRNIVLEFLTDLYIETHADLHVGTLSSNWCRLVDEMKLVVGKTIPFYTPENVYLMVR